MVYEKVSGCEREIDKFGNACDYCGKLTEENSEANESGQRNRRST